MTLGTICSGIGAPEVALHGIGYSSIWCSQFDPEHNYKRGPDFPSAVIAHRFPEVPNYGDFTTLLREPPATPDVLIGGTPCQSFSVAGLRGGLSDPRGGLTLAFVALVGLLRPRWIVWENVPGVFSADDGRAFGSLLSGLGNVGYGWAYRVLDAQYFGVAQRRERVFVVGHSGGDWRRAGAVLFEPEGVRWDSPPRREAGEGVAANACSGLEGGCLARSMNAHSGRFDPETETLIAHSLRGEGHDASEDGTGRGSPLVPVAFNWQSGGSKGRLQPSEQTIALSKSQTPAVLAAVSIQEDNQNGVTVRDVCGALRSSAPGSQSGGSLVMPPSQGVRRLTPREMERLQGFPDDFTRIPWRGKPVEECPDGPRAKALGNSMAVPVLRWLGRRILIVDATP